MRWGHQQGLQIYEFAQQSAKHKQRHPAYLHCLSAVAARHHLPDWQRQLDAVLNAGRVDATLHAIIIKKKPRPDH